jgi:dTDP-4-amino-4,6-dideoxygalactose transaminase
VVADFERTLAERVGAAEAVAVTSGTTALFLGLHALGIGAGDEVIVPSLGFVASVNSILHAGATPVLVDVDPRTYCLDPSTLGGALSARTRAVMAVDQLGIPAEMDRIRAFADARGLVVIEDASCALGSRYQGAHVGGRATLTCYSFHLRKLIVTGEGGMITTEDRELAARLRVLRNQGRTHESSTVVGYNFRMSDVLAALGVAQMSKLDAFLDERRRLGLVYDRAFASWGQVELPLPPPRSEVNRQSYILRMRGATREARDAILEAMLSLGISARRGLTAVHREPCHAGLRAAGGLHQSEEAADQTIVLPLFPGLKEEEQARIIEGLRASIEGVLVQPRPIRKARPKRSS